MGGELSVQSVMGQGSTFSVRLYLREISEPEPDKLQDQRPNVDAAQRAGALASVACLHPVIGYEGPRRTLLVVDDQPIQRQMLAGMLLPLGFVVREAASGHEALESVREQCPDAVLLDISMDDMDGWHTARAIRQAGLLDVPIIMVSANVFENRRENLAAAQCQAFVAKPIMESELLDTLAQHLKLQWRTEPWTLPVAATEVMPHSPSLLPALPDDAAWELQRLTRMGHVQALKTSLAEWQAARPDLMVQWQHLAHLVDQFDLDAVQAHVTPYLTEDIVGESQP
jgi:CheY-like chemotaxis protein